jgi:cbb3-type cytochrome oxidase subunit 3
VAQAFESFDRFIRRWPVAALVLFAVAALFWVLFYDRPLVF